MPKLNDRGAIQFIILLLLIAGLAAGLYLVSQTQIFKPKASSENIEWQISSGQDPDNCVTSLDGKTVTTCSKVKFKVTAPADVTQNTSNSNYYQYSINEDDD